MPQQPTHFTVFRFAWLALWIGIAVGVVLSESLRGNSWWNRLSLTYLGGTLLWLAMALPIGIVEAIIRVRRHRALLSAMAQRH